MAHPAPSLGHYQFGVYTVDVRAFELRKHGVRLKVQERPLHLLILLLERPGEVVTREELRKRLWPAGTFVDFDHGISSAVNKLRSALNDSAAHPRYIETIGRQGYRFLYPVAPHVTPLRVLEQRPVLVPKVKPPRPRWLALAVITALLVATAGGVLEWQRRVEQAPGQIRSLAVLPLKNLSSDPEQEYFSDGLTDEFITHLATLQGLRVISRTSVMQYKGSTKPLPQIARELNVDAIVEGAVLRSGNRVRITAQLIAASDDRHLWAASYDRDQRDILTLQNEVAREVADNIQLTLAAADRQRLSTSRPVDPQTHESYLRGRYHLAKRTPGDIRTAIDAYESAIARDPNYALAYAGLADCYALLGGYANSPQDTFIRKARAAALRAVELDSRLSQAHTSLAVIAQNYDWDWQTAEKEYKEAIRLDPNNATAHHWYAEYLSFEGRFDEAFVEIGR
ncbi:MAG TPA: winged helix-turn-helix domain-containing protein, partial [Terriglobales bacterium]|nr:winged helix-turn-helix domain-containing protein [Terriglobales bacterium]